MGGRRVLALAVACGLVAAGCGGGGDGSERSNEPSDGGLATPKFAAESDGGPEIARSTGDEVAGSPGAAATSTTDTGSAPTDGTATTASTAAPAGAQKQSVAFDDPVGDATPGVNLGSPPPWTDLAGVALLRQGNAYRLTVRLGGDAPQTSNGSETMNIASFYDIDGDDAVDYEIWVNLGPNGWGPVWYDDEGNARPGEQSNVNVVVEGSEVRLLFPDVMLDKPDRFRFSVASEYGPLNTIGSSSARRDDAPDDDQAVSFP